MFGMVFGQAELTTRVYETDWLSNGDTFDLETLSQMQGLDFYLVSIINIEIDGYDGSPNIPLTSVESVQNVQQKIQMAFEEASYPFFRAQYNSRSIFTPGQSDGGYILVLLTDQPQVKLTLEVTAEFPEEDTGYIEEGFDYCIDVGANLIASPCRDAVPILDALPSEIADNLTGIIGQGVAATNQDGNWVGSLSGLGGGNGYWFKSNVSACFNYNCAEN